MLRLPSTQITLGIRDLNWHADRHRHRQSQHTSGYASRLQQSRVRANAETHERHSSRLPYRFPHPPAGVQLATDSNLGNSIIYDEPVPQGSRSFWDGIVADAGTFPRLRDSAQEGTQQLANQTSLSTLGISEPFGTSNSEHLGSEPSYASDEYAFSYAEETILSEADRVEEQTRLRSHLSLDSLDSSDIVNETQTQEQEVPVAEEIQPTTPKHRHSYFNFHRKPRPTRVEEDVPHAQWQFSNHLDLDGSTDPISNNSPNYDGSFDSEAGLDAVNSYRVRRGRRVNSSSIEVDANVEVIADLAKSSSPFSEPDDQSTPPIPILPRSVEVIRSRSGGLPRSPLYISQAAASSSPDKHPNSPSASSAIDANEGISLLSRPSRRPKRYKPHSQSYSFVDSETSEIVRLQNEDMSRNLSFFQDSVSANPASSPPGLDLGSDSLFPRTSTPKIPAYQHRLSPTSIPSPARRLFPSNPFLPPLPPPFSTTPRLVSFTLALPSSSSTNPSTRSSPHRSIPSFTLTNTNPLYFASSDHLTDPPTTPPIPLRSPNNNNSSIPMGNSFRIPSYNLLRPSVAPSLPTSTTTTPPPPPPATPSHRQPLVYIPSPSPPPPMTPHRSMRVYNDALPASSQPQTPVGLGRNGVPSMGYSAASVGGIGRGSSRRVRRGRNMFGREEGDETRGWGRDWGLGMWGMDEDVRGEWERDMGRAQQENVGVEVEAERFWREVERERRRRERGRRTELGSQGGDGGGLGGEALEMTPPRGERRLGE